MRSYSQVAVDREQYPWVIHEYPTVTFLWQAEKQTRTSLYMYTRSKCFLTAVARRVISLPGIYLSDCGFIAPQISPKFLPL